MLSIFNFSLNCLLGTLSFTLTSHIHLTMLISAHWNATSFSFLIGQVSLPCNMLLYTQLLYSLPLIMNDIFILVSNGTNCLSLLYLHPHIVWNGGILCFQQKFLFFLLQPNVRGRSTNRQPLLLIRSDIGIILEIGSTIWGVTFIKICGPQTPNVVSEFCSIFHFASARNSYRQSKNGLLN